MTQRLIQVGTGGQGERWCADFVPANEATGHVEVVGAVDVDRDAHENAVEHLDLSPEQCYTDVETAFADLDADICSCVVPPAFHEDIVDAAVEHDLHVISEKPIADTLEGAVRVAEKVKRAGLKMGVTMSHRFRRDMTTFRRRLRSREFGVVDYLTGRYAVNCRSYGSWDARLYDWEEGTYPHLVDAAVHHLDLLADLAGEETLCEQVFAHSWNPEWSDFDGDPNALVTMRMDDGTTAVYEGVNTNAVTLNGWGSEHVRAECSEGTLIVDGHEIGVYPYDPDAETCVGTPEGDPDPVPLDQQDKWANAWLLEQFVDWVEGGEPMATNVRDNLQSMALVFAAIESAETDLPVDPQELLGEARTAVEDELDALASV